METKKCSKCKDVLPADVDHFFKNHKSEVHKYRPACKQCTLMQKYLKKRRTGKDFSIVKCLVCGVDVPQLGAPITKLCSEKCKGIHLSAYRLQRRENGLATLTSRVSTIRSYGITVDDYIELQTQQRGCCAICKDSLKVPHIDHDHETGEVRGLLCPNCNTGIGLLKDSSEVSMRAATYLMKHGR